MRRDDYLVSIADALGLVIVPWAKTFKNDTQDSKGAVIGLRQGYILSVALVTAGNERKVGVMLRFPRLGDWSSLEKDLKELPEFKTFASRKSLKVVADGVIVGWPYVLKKPKVEEIVAFIDSLIARVSRYAPAFDGKCEDCRANVVDNILLFNRIPGYHCPTCQQRISTEKTRAAKEYSQKDANYLFGFVAAILAAIIAGAAWGGLLGWLEAGKKEWTPMLHALGAVWIGIAVCFLMKRAVGKITRPSQAIAILSTLAGKLWADTLYYSILVGHQHGLSLDHVLPLIAPHILQLKTGSVDTLIILLCDIVFSAMIPWTPWGRMPKFEAVFQPVSAAVQISKGAPVN